MKEVNNLYEFMKERGFGEKSVEDIQRNTYKFTSCGAWFEFEGKPIEQWDCKGLEPQLLDDPFYNAGGKIIIGSIVEGCDYETEQYTLEFPFTLGDFWDSLDDVEIEAEYLWKKYNEEE